MGHTWCFNAPGTNNDDDDDHHDHHHHRPVLRPRPALPRSANSTRLLDPYRLLRPRRTIPTQLNDRDRLRRTPSTIGPSLHPLLSKAGLMTLLPITLRWPPQSRTRPHYRPRRAGRARPARAASGPTSPCMADKKSDKSTLSSPFSTKYQNTSKSLRAHRQMAMRGSSRSKRHCHRPPLGNEGRSRR